MSDYIKREEITKYLFAREKILHDAREVERQDEVFRVLQEVLKLHAADVRENRNGFLCLASDVHKRGTILETPFGGHGKVYDCWCGNNYTIDVYVGW